jgi:hypothetical protein
MPKRRYTLVVAEQTEGLERKVRISFGPVLVVLGAVVTLPVLIGLGAAWKTKSDVASLYGTSAPSSWRTPAGTAACRVRSILQSAISELGTHSALEPGSPRR